jgi:hypothetical protein
MKTRRSTVFTVLMSIALLASLVPVGATPIVEALSPSLFPTDQYAGWEEVGDGSATGGGILDGRGGLPSTAFGPDGAFYITWHDESSENEEIYVLRWNGSNWEEVGAGSSVGGGVSNNLGESEMPSIAVAPDDTPYVVWEDCVWDNRCVYVKRWNGIDWEEVGEGSASSRGISSGQETAIAINSESTPYLAFDDYGEIRVFRWFGGTWEEVASESNSGGVSNNEGSSRWPSIAIAPDDTPYVAWADDTDGEWEIYVRHWNGSDWEEVGAGSATGGGISNDDVFSLDPSIAIAPDGTPYIAWQNENGNEEIYVRRWSENSWEEVGPNSASDGGISNSWSYSEKPSIGIAPDGTVYVGWMDRSHWDWQIYVRQWRGGNWEEVGTGSATDGGISNTNWSSFSPSLSIARDGTPYVAWADQGLYVRRWTGGTSGPVYSISGRVLDEDSNPIPGVTISDGAGHTATTGPDGAYVLSGLPASTYTITPSKSGYDFSPPSRTVSVPPNATGVDFVGTLQIYSISGRVSDVNGVPIAGVTISDDAGHRTTTNSDGNYILDGLSAGTHKITPSTSPPNDYTFSPGWRMVSGPPDATGVDFTARPLPAPTDPSPLPNPGKPYINQVRPCFIGPFLLHGPWVPNRYDAFVDWQGLSPNYVDFILNGVASSEAVSGNPTSHTYNMGSDLNYGLLGTRNILETRAVAQNGAVYAYLLHPIGVDLPIWLPVQPIVLNPRCLDLEVKYKILDWLFPEPPFCEGGACQVTFPDWFPFLAEKSFGIPPAQGRLKAEFSSGGSGTAEGSGSCGFQVAGQEITGALFLRGEGTIEEGKGLTFKRASFGLDVAGEINSPKIPLADAICKAFTAGACPLKQFEALPVIGSNIRRLNERAYAQAKAEPELELAFNRRSKEDQSGWEWENGEGTGRVKLTLALILEVIKGLGIEGYGGGEPSITLQAPPNPSFLKEIVGKLFVGYKIKKWSFENKQEVSFQWSYRPGSAMLDASASSGMHPLSKIGWYPIPRDYVVNPATYSVFQASNRSLQLGGGTAALENGLAALATEEMPIATNVFPDGHPAIAADGSLFLVWVHDDIAKPLMQGEEIFYSVYDGASWSLPAGLTHDTLQDFAPQVAFDRNNRAVAVWERNKVVQSESSELNAAYANAFEIAYAAWNGSEWSSPAYLTDNDALDHAPVLARGQDGSLLLVWRQNSAGELIGTAEAPDTLFYALWDGATWSPPKVFLRDAVGVLDLAAANYNANTMAIVYSQDTDGDLGTGDDQELQAMLWDGSAWNGPVALTDDDQPDNSPTLFFGSGGAPRLLWLKGDTLYALLGDLTGTPQAVTVEASSTILDYAAAQDSAGNLVLLWQGYSEEGVDVYYAAYDQGHDVFSLVEQLTHDEPLEKFMAPAFAPNGEMVMAYNKTALVTERITVSPTLVIENVTTFGQTDLYVLRHTFGPDLALEAADLEVEPANPTPGSTAQLSVTLHNVGDRAVANPEVTFYLGDPSAGGTPIDTATANLTLAGGMTTTLSIDYSVPTSGGPFPIYVVADPDDAAAELDEANNCTNFFVSVPDLTPAWVRVGYGNGQEITLTATLSNTGVVPATPCAVAFRLDDPVAGPVVAVGSTPSLEAGTETEIQATWDASSTPTGRYLIYAVADPDDAVVEADETNNDEWAGVSLLPDLVLRSTGVLTGYNGTNLLVSVWVFNEGQRDANGVTLGLYNQLPKSDTTPLVSTVLDIQAGEHRVATLNMGSYSRRGFYAGVGISGELEDRDVSNNILLVGQAPTTGIYMPIIFKAAAPPAPDLLVTNLIATSHAVTVTIKNQGDVPTSAPFWVDVYFNPSVTPRLNQPWDTIANHGAVWGVTTSIPADGTLTLTTSDSDPYYFRDYSSPAPLPVGANVYALADSVDFSTTYGTVRESNENNNLLGPVTSTIAAGEISPSNQSQPRSAEGLPPRR